MNKVKKQLLAQMYTGFDPDCDLCKKRAQLLADRFGIDRYINWFAE